MIRTYWVSELNTTLPHSIPIWLVLGMRTYFLYFEMQLGKGNICHATYFLQAKLGNRIIKNRNKKFQVQGLLLTWGTRLLFATLMSNSFLATNIRIDCPQSYEKHLHEMEISLFCYFQSIIVHHAFHTRFSTIVPLIWS